ncbi:MAG: NTP transferase domain-containing protein [Bacteroidales bacterium]|nr:NTP transferase domain-containing protein [Candidatus Cacconaster scatequi]
MKAMIFAAGLGTRLKPLTDTMPKALVPVNGEPMLKMVLDRLIAAGYDDIVINIHHFASQIRDYVAANGNFGVRISFSDESDLLRDTGGGIKFAEPLLGKDEPFLVHNVDIDSNLDFGWFREQHRNDAAATLLVSSRKTSRYLLFDDQMRLVGWQNIQTGEIRSPYGGIDPDQCTPLAFSGIHYASPSIFPLMQDFPDVFGIIDFYLSICRTNVVRGVVPDGFKVRDLGKIDSVPRD